MYKFYYPFVTCFTVMPRPTCSASNNFTRNVTFQEPQGLLSLKVLKSSRKVLNTLDSIPQGCNLFLTGVSVIASTSCDITLALLDKRKDGGYRSSSGVRITQRRQQQQPPVITQLDFSIAGEYNHTGTLHMVLGINHGCSILSNNGIHNPTLREVTTETLVMDTMIDFTPVITYRFRGKSKCCHDGLLLLSSALTASNAC